MVQQIIYLLVVIIINNIIIIVQSCPSSTSSCPKYEYKKFENRASILSNISDSYLIGYLSLTGTHQSMTYLSSVLKVRKQELTISAQLALGVRVFDITVLRSLKQFHIFSNGVYLEVLFDHLIEHINQFLIVNPREFVIVIINELDYNKHNYTDFNYLTGSYCDTLNNYINNSSHNRFVTNWSYDDRIGKIRGKILLATYDINFMKCIKFLPSSCLILDNVALLTENNIYITGDIEYKWNKYIQFTTKKIYDNFACYIYDLSVGSNYVWEIAKYGRYYDNVYKKCIEPINYRIVKYYPGNRPSVMTILMIDYVTQEVIDLANYINTLGLYFPYDN